MEDDVRPRWRRPQYSILTNQLRCQLEPKILDFHLGSIGSVVLRQYEGVGDGHVQ